MAGSTSPHAYYPPNVERSVSAPLQQPRIDWRDEDGERICRILPGPQLPRIAWITPQESADEAVEALQDRGHHIQAISTSNLKGSSAIWAFFTNFDRSAITLATSICDSIRQLDIRPVSQAMKGIALAHNLRRQRIGRLHAESLDETASIAMYAAKVMRLPFSFTGSDEVPRDLKLKLSRAASVGCTSYEQRERYLSIYPAADRYHVVSDTIRLENCLANSAM